ncbi:MAG: DNA mismatch repair endonuclease MutL [Deltaproteobacteria bacterium]|nr:DNA mismatch repair endonuclease MutL [Deltaproteobacteria bacterium]
MQNTIHKLEDDIINKIAAGEVVERPASVVKELIENAIDADSTRIVITIKDGGKKLVKVSDNGHGIAAADLTLAVARHATSKIAGFDDIYHLKTKGFRGEALASICSVAKVSLGSKVKGCDASELIMEGGQFIDQRACAHADGTTVTVKYLFYQTPARLKFLKTSATEQSHIVDVVTRLALSHPHIGFALYDNDRPLIEVNEKQDLKSRCISLLGKDLAGYLYEFSGEAEGMNMHGYLGHPQVARSQRFQTHFFVNSRSVNDKILWHAAMEAYRDLLMRGKYPVLVLNLFVDENTIDVNVHPQKSEIRFHHSQQVHHFVCKTIRQRLTGAPWLDGGGGGAATKRDDRSPLPAFISQGQRAEGDTATQPAHTGDDRISGALNEWSHRFFDTTQAADKEEYTHLEQKQIQFGRTKYAAMNPIGQLLGTYILCDTGSEFVIIDQHAAHERVGFEKLLQQFTAGAIPSDPLLIPETFDLKPSDCDILKQYIDEIKTFGIEVEFFGGQTFVIKALPHILENKVDLKKFLLDVIDDIKATGALVSLKDRLHKVLATMACHSQIRANHHLTLPEMTALLKELDEYQFTDFCPHGRPVCVVIPKDELERWFKRVGA